MDLDSIKRVGIIGAGLMGHGIAQVFGHQGYQVSIYDVNQDALNAVPGKIHKNLKVFLDLELTDSARVQRCLNNIALCSNLKDTVRHADLVIEAVSENSDLKQEVFQELEPDLPQEAVVCTNTSAISITDLSKRLGYRERFVGTHFWNPPQVIPCVEVIKGEYTSEEVFETVYRLMKKVKKEPVRVLRDVPGFLGNRLQHAMWREAISLVAKGIAKPEDIDKVVKYGFGLRLAFIGPLETADLAGLDLTHDVQEYLFPYLENSSRTSPELDTRVEQGLLGVKTSQGFHSWTPEKISRIITQRDRLLLTIIHHVVGGADDSEE
jgi:3-hydroxybutyryl-CoA dehydrogenase